MELLSKQAIPAPMADETVFKIALWGALVGFLFVLAGLLVGVALLFYSIQSSVLWGMMLTGIYSQLTG